MFATYGLPRTLVTDNGAQFTSSEFESFLSNNGIRHIKTSPYHPASNGLAERAVQVFKETMKKLPSSDSIETRLSKFLFWYRLTPHSTTGVPPSALLLGRVSRSLLDLLKPSLSTKVRQKQEVQKFNHDGPSRDRKFRVGDAVYVKEFPFGFLLLCLQCGDHCHITCHYLMVELSVDMSSTFVFALVIPQTKTLNLTLKYPRWICLKVLP